MKLLNLHRTLRALTLVLTFVAFLGGITLPVWAELDVDALQKAAKRGDAEGQYQLGLLYDKGDAVSPNTLQAYAWYSLAAAQGEEMAAIKRAKIAKLLTPEQLEQAESLVTKLEFETKSNHLISHTPAMLQRTGNNASAVAAKGPELEAWVQSIKPAAGGK